MAFWRNTHNNISYVCMRKTKNAMAFQQSLKKRESTEGWVSTHTRTAYKRICTKGLNKGRFHV